MILYQKGGPTPAQIKTDPELKFWDEYNTPLDDMEQLRYNDQNTHSWDRGAYDAQGFWKDGRTVDSRGHGTDLYKKPNHPTFSNQSQNHSWKTPGGVWGKGTYTPSWYTKALYEPDHIMSHLRDDPVKLVYGNDTLTNPYRNE